MCVIFFYVNSNPVMGGYKLILASNRDEFYARNTRSLAKWADVEAHVYGGIDLEPGREGGTWLAIGGDNGVFRLGALLNLTGEPRARNAIGRGMIVSDFVTAAGDCGSTIESYNRTLLADCTKYSAFNFVSIEIGEETEPGRISICSNTPPCVDQYPEGECYGFGNSLPDMPFQKVRNGQQRFAKIVQDFNECNILDGSPANFEARHTKLIGELQALLKCREKFWPDAELQRRAPNWGEEMSSLNVDVPQESYGSRTHSVILIDCNNRMYFVEETMAGIEPNGDWQTTSIEKEFFVDEED